MKVSIVCNIALCLYVALALPSNIKELPTAVAAGSDYSGSLFMVGLDIFVLIVGGSILFSRVRQFPRRPPPATDDRPA